MSEVTPPLPSEQSPRKKNFLVQMFQNLKIRTKLTLVFSTLITVLLVYSAVTYLNLSDIRSDQQLAQKSAYENKAAQSSLRKYEKQFIYQINSGSEVEDFYLRGKSTDLEHWQVSYKNFIETFERIEIFKVRAKLPDINNDQELKQAIEDYHNTFLLIVEKQRQLGFFQYGQLGKARDEAVNLEALLTSSDAKFELLQLRQHEKDFLLRNDEQYVRLFDEEVSTLRDLLQTDQQRQSLASYEGYFKAAVALKKEIGLTPQSGLLSQLEKTMKVIQPIVDSTQDKVAQVAEDKITLSIRFTLTLSVLFILLSIFLAYVVSKFIADSINHIRDSALRVMTGKDLQTIPVETQDEVGQLARALNAMTGSMQRSKSVLEQKNLSLAKSIDELNVTKQATLNVLEDLEESKKRIEQEKAKDEAILSSIGDGVVVTDPQRKVLFINNVAQKMIGWTAEEVKGKRWGIDLPLVIDESENVIPEEKHALTIALQKRQKSVASYVYQVKGGIKVAVGVTASPVILADELVGSVVVFRDLTKEQEVERMKTEFISLASHKLRTPLTSMKLFSEMLLAGDGGPLNSQQTGFVKNMSDTNERMIELVNVLLNISRIESGRLIVEPKVIDLRQIIIEVVLELRPRFEAKNENLIVRVNDDLPLINVDPTLIRQVYSNLLMNSLKYTPEGGEISIIVSQKDDGIVSQVSDTGYGIPLKEQGRVFQKFYRGENIIPIEADGTGLGLYLIKVIVESSGGKIWFDSKEGIGTSFYFTIPITGMVAKKGQVRIDQ